MARSTVLLVLFILGVAVLQLLFFVPVVAGGSAVSFGEWMGVGPLFRVDGLALSFGVVWAISLALGLLAQGSGGTSGGAHVGLLIVGLLLVAYALEPLVLAIGWEIAGLGAYLHFYGQMQGGARWRLAGVLHGPGLFVFVPAALGLLTAFEPPKGGVAVEWPLAITLLVGMGVLVRVLYRPQNAQEEGAARWMPKLYAACAPFLLAKMLVGGRWDAWGTWALALVGTVTLLALAWQFAYGEVGGATLTQAMVVLCVVGFALAPLSPMAGLGGVLLLALAAVLSGAEQSLVRGAYVWGLTLGGMVAGVWLISQGALSARYGVIAAVALPVVIVMLSGWRSGEHAGRSRASWLAGALTVLILGLGAAYPQVVVEWLARPATQAMAGGVGATTDLARNWGVGLQIVSPAEVVLASLPATGIGLAVFLAWVVLYWLKRSVVNRQQVRSQSAFSTQRKQRTNEGKQTGGSHGSKVWRYYSAGVAVGPREDTRSYREVRMDDQVRAGS